MMEFASELPLMPQIVADPPAPSCSHLFSGSGFQQSQRLAPDLFFASRARAVREGGALATRAAGRPGFPIRGAAPDRHVGLRGWQESLATNARRLPGE